MRLGNKTEDGGTYKIMTREVLYKRPWGVIAGEEVPPPVVTLLGQDALQHTAVSGDADSPETIPFSSAAGR